MEHVLAREQVAMPGVEVYVEIVSLSQVNSAILLMEPLVIPVVRPSAQVLSVEMVLLNQVNNANLLTLPLVTLFVRL